ncbi:hypothetical protein [Paenibacillus puerhi]|uniref:hypothetical protein n=1 Tax=Paenibacillus puerhi TaxID=2692622 RepID=UPI00135B36B9|nr:hypothetical protein [Paenibacillus puerhi]
MKRSMSIFVLCLAVLMTGWLGMVPSAAHACSCAAPGSAQKQVEDELTRKSAMFAGLVSQVKQPAWKISMSSADKVKVTFEVSTVWKGELGKTVEVYTARSSASCGYENFEEGKSYIVSAYLQEGQLETNICDLTKPLASASEEVAILGDGYPPTPNQAAVGGGAASIAAILAAAAALIAVSAVIIIRLRRSKR